MRLYRLLPILGGAKYATIPQYFLSNPGIEVDDFSSAASWTVEAGTATDNITPGEFRSGTGSLLLTGDATNGAKMVKAITPVSYPNGCRVRLYVYLYAADIAKLDRIYFALRGATWTNYVQFTWAYTERAFHVGWNCLEASHDNASVSGTGWATTFSLMRVWLKAKTGETATASVDSAYIGMQGTAAVVFSFDDANDTIFNYAFPALQKYRARGTFYIDTSLVDTAGQVTAANLQTLNAAGWSICNHSDNSDQLTGGFTAEQITTKLLAAASALDGWGVGDNKLHMSYPGTTWNETVLTGARAAGILTARRGPITTDTPAIEPNGDNLLLIPTDTTIQSDMSVSALVTRINAAVAGKKIAVFYSHNISSDISPTNFEAVIAYCRSINIPIVTIEDIYASISGPVRVRM